MPRTNALRGPSWISFFQHDDAHPNRVRTAKLPFGWTLEVECFRNRLSSIDLFWESRAYRLALEDVEAERV